MSHDYNIQRNYLQKGWEKGWEKDGEVEKVY